MVFAACSCDQNSTFSLRKGLTVKSSISFCMMAGSVKLCMFGGRCSFFSEPLSMLERSFLLL